MSSSGVFLEWSSGGYRMDIGHSEVDLYEYERLAAAGIAAARKGEILRAVGLLEEARVMSSAAARSADRPTPRTSKGPGLTSPLRRRR
ncbi:hypothetical protein OTB20_29530 [Streptomyces sp. H27-H1]|uniref:hypothetical protein n=1 Tax=Streptomyces sp. H27-H1 TaxID=2996461 RepID=UPI00226DB192|nr:hypothetical protein [Streptomyces sp. H27-H1]MCY0930256.1 hypothetical protein [Streptomyces sp. H27-H1]